MGLAKRLITSSLNRSSSNLSSPAVQLALKIAFLGLLSILVATLYPFDFSHQGDTIPRAIKGSLRVRSGPKDIIFNILLFMPLGFGISGLLQNIRSSLLFKQASILCICFTLSCSVELLQNFLPQRSPTSFDVLTNTVGGVLGGLCFCWQGEQILTHALALGVRIRKALLKLPLTLLVAVFLGYLLLSFGTMLSAQTATLSNWVSFFPMYLGNQQTNSSRWEGFISEVQLSDRAVFPQEARDILAGKTQLDETSLIASYDLRKTANYRDQTGQAPELVWRGQGSNQRSNENGAFLSGDHWLETSEPVASISQRIRDTSEFTLLTTLQPTRNQNVLYARIVSIASPDGILNLVIGQVDTDLVCWMHTSEDAQYWAPKGEFKNVFADLKPQRLILTYSGSVLRLYSGGTASHRFNTSFYQNLTVGGQRVLALGKVFLPLAVLLVLIATSIKHQNVLHLVLLCSAAVLPPLVLEKLLALQFHREINHSNILLGLIIMLSPLITLQDYFRWRLR